MANRPHRPRKPYPYTIPIPAVPPDDKLNNADPSLVLEFFRIEALLRSQEVQSLYGTEDGEQYLLENYLFNWSVLKGAHHSLLVGGEANGPYYPMMPMAFGSEGTGVIDLSDSLRGVLDVVRTSQFQVAFQTRTFMKELQDGLLRPRGSKLYIEIDTAYPRKWITEDIHTLYEAKRKKSGIRNIQAVLMRRSNSFYQVPTVHRRFPVIKSQKAWVSYLQCYDLHHCEGLSFGDIAKKIFHAPTGRSVQRQCRRDSLYDQAKNASYSVAKLIRFAVSNQWPPPESL